MKQPTRLLISAKPHRYVPSFSTDIRRTFRRARLLARLQECRREAAAALREPVARPA